MNSKQMAQQVRLAHWTHVMRERSESGASIRQWCGEKGINEKTYYYWQRRLREAACKHLSMQRQVSEQAAQLPQSFTELRVAECPEATEKTSTGKIEVSVIRIKADSTYPPEQLAALLRGVSES